MSGAFRVKLCGSASAAAGGLEEVICRLQGFLITPKLQSVLMPLFAVPLQRVESLKFEASAAQHWL